MPDYSAVKALRSSSATKTNIRAAQTSGERLPVILGVALGSVFGFSGFSQQAEARTVRYTLSGPGPTIDRTYASLLEADDDDNAPFFGTTAELATFFPGYTGTQAISMTYRIRGAPWVESYAAGSPTLVVSIPGTGILTFAGPTRDASFLLYDAFLDSEAGDDAYVRYLRFLLQETAIDALAGNPGSLQSQLMRGGLDISGGNSLLERRNRDGRNPTRRMDVSSPGWVLGAVGAGYTGGDFSGQRLDGRFERHFGGLREGSRSQLKIDLPFTLNVLEGAQGGSVGLGVGYEMLLSDRWSIEPRASVGAVYQPDISTVGAMAVVSISSRFRLISTAKTDVYLGNMIGHSQTLDIASQADEFADLASEDGASVGSDLLSPQIQNTIFRNGIAAERVIDRGLFGRRGSIRASLTNTTFTGDKLAVESYNEVAISMGIGAPSGAPRRAAESLRVGIGYAFGGDYNSGNFSIGWRF